MDGNSKQIALLVLLVLSFRWQTEGATLTNPSELSPTISLTQNLDWFPLSWHPIVSDEALNVTVSLRCESDFSGGYVSVVVVPPAVGQAVQRATTWIRENTRGTIITYTLTLKAMYSGVHCIKLQFEPPPNRTDQVVFLIGGEPLGDRCIVTYTVWEKGLFVTTVVALVGVAVGAIVAVFGFVVTRRQRMEPSALAKRGPRKSR